MKQMSARQMGMIMSITIISLKLLFLPAGISLMAKNDTWLIIAVAMLIDFVFSVIILKIVCQNPNKSFYDLLNNALGKWVAKIIYFIFVVLCVFRLLLSIKETHNYFNESLFDELNFFNYIIPLILFLFFITSKDIIPIARASEFVYWVIIAGLIFTMVIPLASFDFVNLLPVLNNSAPSLFNGYLRAAFCCLDSPLLLLLMGKYEVNKKTFKTILSFQFFTMLIVIIFYIIFIAVFGDFAINRILAVSDLPLHATFPTSIGRFDWVAIIIWTLALEVNIGINAYACFFSLVKLIGGKFYKFSMILVQLIIITGVFFFYLNLSLLIKILYSPPVYICTIIFQIALPIVFVISYIIIKKKAKFKGDSNDKFTKKMLEK